MSDHIELTEPCGLLTVPGVREYVCRLEPVGDDTVNVTVCAPTEPIVRCRDCKYGQRVTWSPGSGIPGDFLDCTGELVQTWDYLNDEPEVNPVKPDGFCSWGERKVEG